MDASIALGYAVYAVVAYVLAHMLYRTVKASDSVGILPVTPYDAQRLVLKRRYI
jgi:hypothetical protein